MHRRQKLAQELLGTIMTRLQEKFFGGCLFQYDPFRHERDPMRNFPGKAHLMRNHHHGHAG